MKIIRLCFKNINSLAGLHTINFDQMPLSGTGIFAITGPTGAGKSTLLDAITLAIFNQTPRTGGKVSKAMVQDQGIIMTRNTNEAFTEVDYQIKDQTYRSKWAIRKTRTGTMADYDMELSMLKNGEFAFVDNGLKKSDIPSRNAEIIGLSFDQFVKSILLSQGEFAKFLQAKPKERTELLEQITGMEIYKELGKASFAKRKEEEERLSSIKSGTENLQPRSEEEMEQLTNERTTLETELNTTKANNEKLFKENENRKLLLKTTAELAITKQEEHKLSEKNRQFAPQLEKLRIHSRVLTIKSECDSIKELEQQEKQVSTDIKESATTLAQVKEAQINLQAEIAISKELLDKHRSENEQWQPKIEMVRTIDIQIDRLKEANRKNEKDHEKATIKKANCISETAANNQKISEAEKRLTTLKEQAKDKHNFDKLDEVIFETKNAINTITPLSQEVISKLKAADDWGIIEVLKQGKWEEAETILKNKNQTIDEELQTLRRWTEANPETEEELANRKATLEKDRETLQNMETLSLQVVEINSDLKELASSKEKSQKEQTIYQNKLTLLAKDLNITSADLKIEMAIQERIALQKKYESDRLKLVDGDPCFLCGSLHHPYLSGELKLDNTTESKTTSLENKITTINNQTKTVETQLQGVQFFLKNNEETTIKLNRKKEIITEDFNSKNRYPSLKIELLSELKETLQTVSETIKAIENHLTKKGNSQKLELKKEQVSSLLANITKIITHKNSAINKASLFSAFIPKCNGLNEINKQLVLLSAKHQQELELIRNLSANLESDKKLAIQLQKNLVEAEKEWQTLTGFQNETLEQLKKESTKRQNISSEIDINSFEKRLLQTIKEAEEKTNIHLNKLEKNRGDQENLEKYIAKSERELTTYTQRKSRQLTSISPSLKELGLSSYCDVFTLLIPPSEISAIENEEKILKEKTVSISAKRRQLSIQIEEINCLLVYQEEDEIVAKRLQEIQELQSKQQSRVGSIEQIFKEEKAKQEKLGAIAKQISQQQIILDKWRKLEIVIGDAKGARFSQLAQDLTLVFMLQFTNLHLNRLSGRYQLKHHRKDTQNDDLWIVDKWQGNEERSVRTLSGGESFLVSLALALGLSDLAGKKTKIESLFIDEGFGTLDQETLEIALETLQKLQYETNRTIGIISHVPALKERISTQIEIVKSPNGHSAILVRQ